MNRSTAPLRAPQGDMSMWFPHHLLPPTNLSLLYPHLQPYLLQRMEERRLCMSPFLGTSDPLQYMDWCDVVTVGCLDFPSLDIQVHTITCSNVCGIQLSVQSPPHYDRAISSRGQQCLCCRTEHHTPHTLLMTTQRPLLQEHPPLFRQPL